MRRGTEKTTVYCLLSTTRNGQRTMFTLGLMENRVVDFLLVLIELFCLVLWLRRYE